MNTYTVIAYVVPAGGHHIETVRAINPTDAAIRLREKLELPRAELEIVAVAAGPVRFALLDATHLALAPYHAASP